MSTRYVWGRYTIEDYERLEHDTAGAITSSGGAVYDYADVALRPTSGNPFYTTATSESTIQSWIESGISRFGNSASPGESIQFPARTYIAFNSSSVGTSARSTIFVYYTGSSQNSVRFESEGPNWSAYPTSSLIERKYYMESGKEAGRGPCHRSAHRHFHEQ